MFDKKQLIQIHLKERATIDDGDIRIGEVFNMDSHGIIIETISAFEFYPWTNILMITNEIGVTND
jgi:hypothetical protein